MKLLKVGFYLVLFLIGIILLPSQIQAGEVLGIHILQPYEIEDAARLIKTSKNFEEWSYVTIPFGVKDAENVQDWQRFFDRCRELKIVPIVRLITFPEGENWVKPVRGDIVKMAASLSSLNWPSEERIVIIFNEPNHAKEWGGQVNPEEYADILAFSLDWFQNEKVKYTVLPGAADLAAPNSSVTMEAFNFWRRVFAAQPQIAEKIDAWNSHSYPNPGFTSSPYRDGQNSLRGFEHELRFLSQYSDRKYDVYITETGWVQNGYTSRLLRSYYQYTMDNIWSHPQVKVVTPFLLKGAPGPFASFSFIDQFGNNTSQFEAYRNILENSQDS